MRFLVKDMDELKMKVRKLIYQALTEVINCKIDKVVYRYLHKRNLEKSYLNVVDYA